MTYMNATRTASEIDASLTAHRREMHRPVATCAHCGQQLYRGTPTVDDDGNERFTCHYDTGMGYCREELGA